MTKVVRNSVPLGRSHKSPMGATATGSKGAFGAPGPNIGGLAGPMAPPTAGFKRGGAVQEGHHTHIGHHSMAHDHDDSGHKRGHSEFGFKHMHGHASNASDKGMSAGQFAAKHGGEARAENKHRRGAHKNPAGCF